MTAGLAGTLLAETVGAGRPLGNSPTIVCVNLMAHN